MLPGDLRYACRQRARLRCVAILRRKMRRGLVPGRAGTTDSCAVSERLSSGDYLYSGLGLDTMSTDRSDLETVARPGRGRLVLGA